MCICLPWLMIGPVTGFCGTFGEPLAALKSREFFDYQRNCQLLKKQCVHGVSFRRRLTAVEYVSSVRRLTQQPTNQRTNQITPCVRALLEKLNVCELTCEVFRSLSSGMGNRVVC
jgi:hypothetical protein